MGGPVAHIEFTGAGATTIQFDDDAHLWGFIELFAETDADGGIWMPAGGRLYYIPGNALLVATFDDPEVAARSLHDHLPGPEPEATE